MNDSEILQIWNTLPNRIYTEARVFSCAVSAFENSGKYDRQRALAVMRVVWPKNAKLDPVPSEIWGNNNDQRQKTKRQADLERLLGGDREFRYS